MTTLGSVGCFLGTRLPVAHVQESSPSGMASEEISLAYGGFPKEALQEALKPASEILEIKDAAA